MMNWMPLGLCAVVTVVITLQCWNAELECTEDTDEERTLEPREEYIS